MKNFLAVFNAFPAVLAAVQAVEAAVPLPQAGVTKLNMVLNAAAAAWELSQAQQQLSKSTTINAITAIASLTVSELNAAGVFPHGTAVTPAPAASTPVSSN